VTSAYCTKSKSESGAPGTAKKGENGCISNCGTKVIRGERPSTFYNIGFYEGYNLGRDCLYQSALQFDASNTHIFFSFGTFDDSYKVSVGDVYGQFEFDKFKRLSDKFKKVISIGGWDFSTFPTHYHFSRNGVLPGNRQKLANSLADFVKDHNLDGINIDWEYPGVGVSFGS
jgi:hypothetical protein